jgi:hypothetical protein
MSEFTNRFIINKLSGKDNSEVNTLLEHLNEKNYLNGCVFVVIHHIND